MSTVVGVMDRAGFEANTDNLVLADPDRARLLWVPRDLWCDTVADRINAAYAMGGHDLLVRALRDHGLEATHSVVLSRTATEAALARVLVVVPVPGRMVFTYPLAPTARIEEGSKQVTFEPPAQLLKGERVHQWIGARGGSDLHRIERQKVLVRRLLEQGFAWHTCLADASAFRCSAPGALDELRVVGSTWAFETFGPVEPALIDGKQVLVRR